MTSDSSTSVLIIIFCVLFSGYFSATETAFSSLNRIRVKNLAEKGDKKAKLVLDLLENFDSLLSTILIGNNIVNIACASVATLLFVRLLGEEQGPSVATLVITIVVLVFGEVTPKSIAKENPEKFAMFAAPFLNLLMIILTPFNFLFIQWKKLVSRIFHTETEHSITEEELLTIVEEAEQEGRIDEQESSLIRSAIEFSEQEAIDILTPRIDIVGVPYDALILSKSDYVATMSTMYLKQDSLYEATYHAYTTGDFATVKLNYDYMNEHYKMSTLMPKFAFLNAMSVGKTQSAEIFKQSLENLVTTFPQSDVTSMSKDILALMEQGKEAQQGSSHGTLLSRREVVIEEEHAEDNADKNFQTETATPFMIVFEILGEQKDANKMLYDVASFNFTKFLIKDFDLKVVKRNDKCYWLVISGLENLKDAQWYFKTFDAEPTLHLYVLQSKYVFISEDNYKLLGNINLGWDEYVDFYQKNIFSQK